MSFRVCCDVGDSDAPAGHSLEVVATVASRKIHRTCEEGAREEEGGKLGIVR